MIAQRFAYFIPQFRAVIVVVGLLLSTLLSLKSAHGETPNIREVRIDLAVGENRTLPAHDVKSYSEGTSSVANVRLTPEGNQFVIVGKTPGRTTLLTIKKNGEQFLYRIYVSRVSMDSVESELEELVGDTTGLRIRSVGSRIFVEGGVSNEAELKRVERIAALYPGQVESLVVLGGAAAERKQNIRIDFYFIQYERGRSFDYGVNWPTGIAPGVMSMKYDLIGRNFTEATAEIVDQPLPGLDLAATVGYAKILKHSAVITANGTEATYSSGGDQNYRIASGLAATLQPLPFGTKVTVLPRYDSYKGEMSVKIQANVIDLTAPAFGADLPGRSTNEIQTLVSLKLGQGIVLSGISTKSQTESSNGIPFLQEIPVLGVLFGSKTLLKGQLDGAIYMVPSVIEAVPLQHEQLLEELLDEYNAYDRDDKPIAPRAQRSGGT